MKKHLPLLSLILTASVLTSCDNVKEPDRFIPVERQEAQKIILIEEFTGQLCTNCPDGHEAIHNLLEAYPEEIVAVSIHPYYTDLAIPDTRPGGLGTLTGEEYFRNAGSPPMPSAVINRQTGALNISDWAAACVRLMAEETPLTLDAHAVLSDDGEHMNIDIDLMSIDNLKGKLQVWVVQNGIIALQLDHGTYVTDYVHNHVFRTAVNGTWGEDINLAPYDETTVSYSQEMAADWVPDNMYVVAFVYNDGGVVQAVQCKLSY